ncbi:hypothetical protein, partial [Nocardia cyriacigeorgica]|uniref:hypothetical protein n=1 Tax=Nocardia cyriacigeorgica TaxID=135487 RepID=UPI002457F9AF
GQTCFAAGETKCTYGTGAFLLSNTGTAPVRTRHGLLTTLGFRLGTVRRLAQWIAEHGEAGAPPPGSRPGPQPQAPPAHPGRGAGQSGLLRGLRPSWAAAGAACRTAARHRGRA